jgi:hypothetical protein
MGLQCLGKGAAGGHHAQLEGGPLGAGPGARSTPPWPSGRAVEGSKSVVFLGGFAEPHRLAPGGQSACLLLIMTPVWRAQCRRVAGWLEPLVRTAVVLADLHRLLGHTTTPALGRNTKGSPTDFHPVPSLCWTAGFQNKIFISSQQLTRSLRTCGYAAFAKGLPSRYLCHGHHLGA